MRTIMKSKCGKKKVNFRLTTTLFERFYIFWNSFDNVVKTVNGFLKYTDFQNKVIFTNTYPNILSGRIILIFFSICQNCDKIQEQLLFYFFLFPSPFD